jgi:predicted RNA methylase
MTDRSCTLIDDDSISFDFAQRDRELDSTFDTLFPAEQRSRSKGHWTPIDVAVRACSLLAPTPDCRVLDVGSGVGKLCLVGAATTKASWVGVESNGEMVRAARDAARSMGLEARVTFLHEDATRLDWTRFDAIYFFNPFAEESWASHGDVAFRMGKFFRMLERVDELLLTTRPGTRVVTYYGIGGSMPSGFTLIHREPARQSALCLWTRNKGL